MNPREQSVNDEDKQQATQRLLFGRATMNDSTPVIFEHCCPVNFSHNFITY
jgi:hypothetical protein